MRGDDSTAWVPLARSAASVATVDRVALRGCRAPLPTERRSQGVLAATAAADVQPAAPAPGPGAQPGAAAEVI